MMKILIFCISLAFFVSAQAQTYNTALGLRLGLSNGLTIKHFISSKSALEVIAASRWKGANLTALYEINKTLSGSSFSWYYGVGGHFGYWRGNNVSPWFHTGDNYTVIGIDGIVGLEYNFSETPFNVSLDYKPGLNLIGYSGFWGDEVGLSLRYILSKK
ncbi:MAG: hypothetical protein NTW54_08580 [Bacteroidetes bacterium]|nr:hypothetical protein [Bacteroidota bacterium]